jgi:hypothetical protein
MSQNSDAQSRTAGPQPKPSDANRPGSRLLDVAIVIYLMTLAAFVVLAALGIHTETSKVSATVLLVVPVAFLGMIFGLFYAVAFVSSLTSVPLISFSNGLSAMQRNFRGIVGTVLLLAVSCAVLTIAAS